ncbi:MAG: hypothetical protein IT249_19980 [Chitinophagaceae bacterium]|nr:hypothetical protein [Chitinophagaceae bacterium]
MKSELFNPYADCISAAISKADNPEKIICCAHMIEQLEHDFQLLPSNNHDERYYELREELQRKHEEICTEYLTTQCGIHIKWD